MVDFKRKLDVSIDQRLCTDPVIWLHSTRPDGRPHVVPVWFLWDGATILIFSLPNTQKLRNLQHCPTVMLALDSANQGSQAPPHFMRGLVKRSGLPSENQRG